MCVLLIQFTCTFPLGWFREGGIVLVLNQNQYDQNFGSYYDCVSEGLRRHAILYTRVLAADVWALHRAIIPQAQWCLISTACKLRCSRTACRLGRGQSHSRFKQVLPSRAWLIE